MRHLERCLDFVQLRVAKADHRIELNRRRFKRGITFEVPRGSLMTAVEHQIFDDLLIGNFMSTTLHGDFGQECLYPNFSPYVAKFSDNGRARTPEELDRYFADYRARDPVGFLRHQLDIGVLRPMQQKTANVLRESLGPDSPVYRKAKGAYWELKRRLL